MDNERHAIKQGSQPERGTPVDSLVISVPRHPEPECIDSMCLRYDHSFGLKNFTISDSTGSIVEETDEAFERRRSAIRTVMRQLYEEATGQGFFRR